MWDLTFMIQFWYCCFLQFSVKVSLAWLEKGPEAPPALTVPAQPPALPPPPHGPGPHVSPPQPSASAPAAPQQHGWASVPHSPALPSHGPTRWPTSRPGLGLSSSPGRCPMSEVGAAPLPPAALLLAGVVGRALPSPTRGDAIPHL